MIDIETWREYRRTRDADLRQELIINYLPLVKYLAGRLAVKLPPCTNQEDMESYGVFGLMEAIDKYDPEQGTRFEAYAYSRVLGAMIDEVRKLNWVPRTLMQKMQEVNVAREKVERKHHGPVTGEMLAAEMGITLEELRRITVHFDRLNLMSMDETLIGADGERLRRGDLLEDRTSPDPLEIIERKEGQRILGDAISRLPERDRTVLALYYQEGLTLREIGHVLDISESRVCQLHTRALAKLREFLATREVAV
ncbi:MAG: FliA/WhiG family RNA polymerase sigma factor [Peptococcaceae bacterium]|jgi:RNA polymerase sigma factor for flagellar operon FliA|nr:FliA/WhiG family RNA polymerase sigma factor [Peptococcaceae bacterium]